MTDIEQREVDPRHIERQAKLYAALAKAQGAMKNPDRNRTVDTGKYKFDYATLDNIIDTARAALSSNEIAVVQMLDRDATGVSVLVTRLVHSGGGMMMNEMPISLPGKDAKIQELGSVITYARRYAICAMLNIAAEEDDDGNAGTAATKDRGARPPQREEEPAGSGTREAFKRIRKEIADAKDALGIADVLLKNKDALMEIKKVSEDGYSQLMKQKDDRISGLNGANNG